MTKHLFSFAVLLVSAMALVSAGAASATTNPPAIGTSAPDFSLTTDEGKPASLKDHRGKWVVLYFYPKDFTSGCTLEAHNFQRDLARYEEMGAVILGVSVDSADSHKSFCAKEGLSFRLLSDPGAKVSAEYGSLMEHGGAKYSSRNTFIVDPGGKVAKVFTGVNPAGHSEEVLNTLASLQKR